MEVDTAAPAAAPAAASTQVRKLKNHYASKQALSCKQELVLCRVVVSLRPVWLSGSCLLDPKRSAVAAAACCCRCSQKRPPPAPPPLHPSVPTQSNNTTTVRRQTRRRQTITLTRMRTLVSSSSQQQATSSGRRRVWPDTIDAHCIAPADAGPPRSNPPTHPPTPHHQHQHQHQQRQRHPRGDAQGHGAHAQLHERHPAEHVPLQGQDRARHRLRHRDPLTVCSKGAARAGGGAAVAVTTALNAATAIIAAACVGLLAVQSSVSTNSRSCVTAEPGCTILLTHPSSQYSIHPPPSIQPPGGR